VWKNKNHRKRDDSMWQEDRHLHRRSIVAVSLALTRKALPGIIPFDQKRNLPPLTDGCHDNKKPGADLILNTRPFP